ncbi:MAG: chemotaxis protein CheW, partial [Candidatus Omnitrophica bacterium]|nr:chemotaxis protein CheW [Candidatus Omnitrophota bacterium]
MQRRLHETAEKGKIIQLIIFQLGDEEFGTDIDQVREIVRLGPITPIPDSPDFIKGVTNVRGEIAVVIDLKRRFFLRMKKNIEEKHIIITEQENNLFGLMVDEVSEVLRIPETDIKATPELVTRIDRVYINGVLTLENRLIIMLDLRKV